MRPNPRSRHLALKKSRVLFGRAKTRLVRLSPNSASAAASLPLLAELASADHIQLGIDHVIARLQRRHKLAQLVRIVFRVYWGFETSILGVFRIDWDY